MALIVGVAKRDLVQLPLTEFGDRGIIADPQLAARREMNGE